MQYTEGKALLVLYSSVLNFTHTSNLKSTTAYSMSGQLFMPVAISILRRSFNLQNKTVASALSAGPELPPEPCQGWPGRMLLVLDLVQGLCCQQFNSVSCGLQVCSSVPWHLLVHQHRHYFCALLLNLR